MLAPLNLRRPLLNAYSSAPLPTSGTTNIYAGQQSAPVAPSGGATSRNTFTDLLNHITAAPFGAPTTGRAIKYVGPPRSTAQSPPGYVTPPPQVVPGPLPGTAVNPLWPNLGQPLPPSSSSPFYPLPPVNPGAQPVAPPAAIGGGRPPLDGSRNDPIMYTPPLPGLQVTPNPPAAPDANGNTEWAMLREPKGGVEPPDTGSGGTGGDDGLNDTGSLMPPPNLKKGRFDPSKPADPVANRPPNWDEYIKWRDGSGRANQGWETWAWLKNNGNAKERATGDPEQRAAWYSTFGPEFYKVTAADVRAYDANNFGVAFDEWYRRYRDVASTDQPPPPNDGPSPIAGMPTYDRESGAYVDGQGNKLVYDPATNTWIRRGAATPAQLGQGPNWGGTVARPGDPSMIPVVPPPGSPGVTPPTEGGQSTPLPQTSTPPTQTPPPSAPTNTTTPQSNNFTDALTRAASQIRALYGDEFKGQLDDEQRRLLHIGSLTGAVDAGGFTGEAGRAMNDLRAKQNAEIGGQLANLTGTFAQVDVQKYAADLDAEVKRFGITTNAELERFLADKQDVLQRYIANLNASSQKYSADRGVDAAALHAAASSAAANANAEAQRYGDTLRYKTSLVNADVTREGNILQFISSNNGNLADWIRLWTATDPSVFLTGQPPGDVVIKP